MKRIIKYERWSCNHCGISFFMAHDEDDSYNWLYCPVCGNEVKAI